MTDTPFWKRQALTRDYPGTAAEAEERIGALLAAITEIAGRWHDTVWSHERDDWGRTEDDLAAEELRRLASWAAGLCRQELGRNYSDIRAARAAETAIVAAARPLPGSFDREDHRIRAAALDVAEVLDGVCERSGLPTLRNPGTAGTLARSAAAFIPWSSAGCAGSAAGRLLGG